MVISYNLSPITYQKSEKALQHADGKPKLMEVHPIARKKKKFKCQVDLLHGVKLNTSRKSSTH